MKTKNWTFSLATSTAVFLMSMPLVGSAAGTGDLPKPSQVRTCIQECDLKVHCNRDTPDIDVCTKSLQDCKTTCGTKI